jgi:DNA-binding CsgD family transcriptional regulator
MRPSSRILDLKVALSTWRPEDPPALTWFLPELREMLRAEFVGAYQPMVREEGWTLEFMQGAGDRSPFHIQAFRELVKRLPASDDFLGYNPYLVEKEQRSRALLLRELPRKSFQGFAHVQHAVGVADQDQLRVLACDGPRLMSWVGATRTERFTRREVCLLGYLTEPLRRRLGLERQLRPTRAVILAVEAALEAVGRAAFVVGPAGNVEVANRAGFSLLERDARRVLASIRESERRGSSAGFAITRLAVPGYPAYVLAIQNEAAPSLSSRVSLANRRWKLTARQTRVLELMGTGATNQEIASQLSCAKVTVENHVTELFRRSGARSRADLVRRLFFLAP